MDLLVLQVHSKFLEESDGASESCPYGFQTLHALDQPLLVGTRRQGRDLLGLGKVRHPVSVDDLVGAGYRKCCQLLPPTHLESEGFVGAAPHLVSRSVITIGGSRTTKKIETNNYATTLL